MQQAGPALSALLVCWCACDREPEPPPAADPPAQEEISPATRERVEELVRERTDEEVEADVEDDSLDAPSPIFTYSLEEASISDVSRILAQITGRHVAIASVLHGLVDCVAISVTAHEPIAAAHVIELTRVGLAEIQIELRPTPNGFVIRPMDGRTIACGAIGRATLAEVPAPAIEYVPRDVFADPAPGEQAFTVEAATLPEVASALSSAFGQTFEVDAALAANEGCVRVSVYGHAPIALDGVLDLVRLAVADANVELDRRYVFRSIANRELRCSAR